MYDMCVWVMSRTVYVCVCYLMCKVMQHMVRSKLASKGVRLQSTVSANEMIKSYLHMEYYKWVYKYVSVCVCVSVLCVCLLVCNTHM